MKIRKIASSESNVFDRQERISWWNQEKLANAKVMVVGAGAIGNETLKNLALLGIGNFFIIDMDEISTSNLSRTVLFGPEDIGKSKSEIAAIRTKKMSLAKNVSVDWFHGDLVWDLGLGVFREMDIVLGYVDSIETRFAINKKCALAGTPWIDAGIHELGLRVNFFSPPTSTCYACNTTKEQRIAKRYRYSCGHYKKKVIAEGKVPTTQIASAMVAAIQVQETIKYLCGEPTLSGKQIYFQGKSNDFDLLRLSVDPNCEIHQLHINEEIIRSPFSNEVSIKEFLIWVKERIKDEPIWEFQGEEWAFVKTAGCLYCNKEIVLMRPSYKIFVTEIVCENCKQSGTSEKIDVDTQKSIREKALYSIDLTEDEEILNLTLNQIGVSLWQIINIRGKASSCFYIELLGDKSKILPELIKSNSH